MVDPAEAERAALAVARNCGFALVFEGLNPLTVTDDRLRAQLAGRPVVRVTAAEPVRPGPPRPGLAVVACSPARAWRPCSPLALALRRR